MHKIVIDRIHKLVEQRMIGTVSIDDIVESGAAVRQAVRSLGLPPGAHISLYDLSEMGAFSDDAIDEAFREWADPRFTCVRARKVALVAPSTLVRMRIARLSESRPGLSVFGTRHEAMRWLLA